MSGFRLLLLAALAWVGFVLYSEAAEQSRLATPDQSKVIFLYFGTLLDGGAIAAILAVWIVPIVGQSIGNFFFNPGGSFEFDDYDRAIAKLAQGDPEGAIRQYERILAKDPNDTRAISEIARICCDSLGDTARGAATLARALEGEWSAGDSSFLANRLADIYLLQDSPALAREVMLQVTKAWSGTRFAADAERRIQQIDHAIRTGSRAPASTARDSSSGAQR